MYWHWHSLHNACETYWKGILSQDFEENEVYQAVKETGNELAQYGAELVNLKKKNQVAILVSNEALTALKWFPIGTSAECRESLDYNDMVRWIYDRLYRMNVECDVIFPEDTHLEEYQLVIVPALYAAPETLLERLNQYVEKGGTLFATFKSAFTNEYVKVSHQQQPAVLSKCLGVSYHQFTHPKNVFLAGDAFSMEKEDQRVHLFMELLIPEKDTKVLASYDHYNWNRYAAFTSHDYGKGHAFYLGCMTGEKMTDEILQQVLEKAGVTREEKNTFPVIIRKGRNTVGKTIRFYFNYSAEKQTVAYEHRTGTDLLTGKPVNSGEFLSIEPWNFRIIWAEE